MKENSRQNLTEKHSLIEDAVFRFKSTMLIARCMFKNIISPVSQFKKEGKLLSEKVISLSQSQLWNPHDNTDNWILTAGKIENLRIAAKRLNGIEVKANKVFSFWKHIGNPNFGKGYVVGREIREGCIIPTIAGGLCQLSNALYEAALEANFKIIERHKHTKVVKGSLAEKDKDATVKWNYVDLRFSSEYDFRIEIELTAEKLVVVFKSKQKNISAEENSFRLRSSNKLNDCYSCGNISCFKHPDKAEEKQKASTTTFILDEKWPEFNEYIQRVSGNEDSFIVPIKKNKLIKTNRYAWTIKNEKKMKVTTKEGISRALKLRFFPKNKNNVFELTLKLDRKIAVKAASLIPVESTHLIISQNLLPFIYETGALGGRTFDVLMTRLPVEKLHERLDQAYLIHSESKTLNDFRAPEELIILENIALTKARKVITPHSEIAEVFKNKVEKLSWLIKKDQQKVNTGNKVLFPASAIGRKGGYEIKKLSSELNLQLVISGNISEHDDFWEGREIEKFNGRFEDIGLVVYPVYVEHQPRLILKAISKGIPVITTIACGLDSSDKVINTEVGNYAQLKEEVKKAWIKQTPNIQEVVH